MSNKMDPVVHFEMPAEDRERMADFYTKAFGWQTQMLGPEMGEYVRGSAAAKMLTTDGPFAETKEHLGGFILIDAKDLNEAIRVAAGIPLSKLGSIEVRPVMGLDAG